ncbi:MAG: Holliday junction resolvase RuvX [Blastocatellia bacterium]
MANIEKFTKSSKLLARGRILALDPGRRRIGIAISDEDRLIATPLEKLERRAWKTLLSRVHDIIREYDAKALVIGLPLSFEGTETEMSRMAREWARRFELSLEIPVFLEDERVTSYEAAGRLWRRKKTKRETDELLDSEAAAIILETFLERLRAQDS